MYLHYTTRLCVRAINTHVRNFVIELCIYRWWACSDLLMNGIAYEDSSSAPI